MEVKSIVVNEFGAPEVMRLVERQIPEVSPDQVLVKIEAIGVNPVECYIRSGKYAALPALPYTPGTDGAGYVHATGSNVQGIKTGQRVYLYGSLSGTYAEYSLCAPTQVYPLPERISYPQGAALGVPYFTAWRALFHKGKATAGETVLVHGASGGVGTAVVQMARSAGLTVIGSASTDAGRDLVLAQGAHFAINHSDTAKVLELTSGNGPDLIIEMLANVNLQSDLQIIAKQGRIVVVGNRGQIEIDPRLMMSKEISVNGVTLTASSALDLKTMHSAIQAGMEMSVLNPIIDKSFSLEQAPEAHTYIMEANSAGKVVLIP